MRKTKSTLWNWLWSARPQNAAPNSRSIGMISNTSMRGIFANWRRNSQFFLILFLVCFYFFLSLSIKVIIHFGACFVHHIYSLSVQILSTLRTGNWYTCCLRHCISLPAMRTSDLKIFCFHSLIVSFFQDFFSCLLPNFWVFFIMCSCFFSASATINDVNVYVLLSKPLLLTSLPCGKARWKRRSFCALGKFLILPENNWTVP